MKQNQTDERACQNCRYYSQHYFKKGSRLYAVECGNCIHPCIKVSKKHRTEPCEFWERAAPDVAQRRTSVKTALLQMAERLDELTQLLKDDSD